MSVEDKKKLLFFCTGSDRSPIKGLGSMTFVISRNGPDSDRLPTAHTCFNHLLLPEYSDKEKLRVCLMTAINNAEGFGLM
jgi:ubiquitin-protein ligase E3 A